MKQGRVAAVRNAFDVVVVIATARFDEVGYPFCRSQTVAWSCRRWPKPMPLALVECGTACPRRGPVNWWPTPPRSGDCRLAVGMAVG